MKKVLFTATVDSHIKCFHIPYLKYFKDKGYEVHVATNGSDTIPYCDVKHCISFERSPFKLRNIKALINLRKIINEEKFDIIHCHTPVGGVITRLASIRTRKVNKTRVIYTAHGFHFYKGASLFYWIIFYNIEKFLSRYTDTIITINKEDYNRAKKHFHSRIEYIPGGVGIVISRFNIIMSEEKRVSIRKSLGINKDDFVMIYTAELTNRKNQEWLINTLKNPLSNNSNMHLLLAGRDDLDNKIGLLINKLNLSNVHLLGFRTDIPELLKISDLALSSSKSEGLPVNIIEAMASGLPIVATNCRGNRDLVENGINGFIVNQNDSVNFIDSINKIYNKKVNVNLMKKSNIKKSAIYDLNITLEYYKKIYEREC